MAELLDRFPLRLERSAAHSWSLKGIALIPIGVLVGISVLLFSWKGSLIALGALIAVVILLRPDWGLFLVVGNMPIINALGGSKAAVVSSIKILGLLTFASWFIHFTYRRSSLVKAPQNRFVVAYIIVVFFSLFFAKDFKYGLMFAATCLLNSIFYFLIVNIIDSQKRLSIVVWTLMISVTAVAIMGIAQYFLRFHIPTPANIAKFLKGGTLVSHWQGGLRITSTQVEPNTLGLILLIVIPPTFFIFIRESSVALRLCLAIALVALIVGIVFTYSRMAFLGLVVAAICIWFKVKAKIKVPIVVLLLMGLVVAVPFMPGRYLSRIKSITHIGADPAIQGRLKLWAAGLPVLRDHLLTGVGVGNFAATVNYAPPTHMGVPAEAHNTYLEVATELGILGFVFFMGLVWLTLRDLRAAQALARRANDVRMLSFAQGLWVSFMCYLFCGIFVSFQYLKYFWFLVALAPAMRRIIQKSVAAPTETTPESL